MEFILGHRIHIENDYIYTISWRAILLSSSTQKNEMPSPRM